MSEQNRNGTIEGSHRAFYCFLMLQYIRRELPVAGPAGLREKGLESNETKVFFARLGEWNCGNNSDSDHFL